MSGRKVILLSPENGFSHLLPHLNSEGWGGLAASNIAGVGTLLNKNKCSVGLVDLDHWGDFELAEMEEFVLANRSMEWIALVSHDSLQSESMRKFIKDLCYDYHLHPIEMDRLLVTMGHAYGKAELGCEGQNKKKASGSHGMIGNSPAMQKLYRTLEKINGFNEPVLIGGESGTGKELAARAIHQLSSRHAMPFVAVNCGALPPSLIQSELFGHERGAFTGAHQRKIGRIEAAAGGTIFLDEIGDLPIELQVNLLHFLQDKTIERVGSNLKITVDARIIAATHVNLEEAIEHGRFREDLYYRLNVLQLNIPPLREREGDIVLLAEEYFKRFSQEKKCSAQGFSKQTLLLMNRYPWPGNVRELINRVRRAMVMSESRLLVPADLGLDKRTPGRDVIKLENARVKADQELVLRALNSNHNNVSEAARELGVSRATMYRLISKFSNAGKHLS